MNWLAKFARRIRMLIHRRQFGADLEEEMRLHLELRQEEQLEPGMTGRNHLAATVTQAYRRSREDLGLCGSYSSEAQRHRYC
jgi:hypothetical protein